MADLTADQIAAIDDIRIASIDVPEWGGTVYLRMLPVGEHEALYDWHHSAKGKLQGFQAEYLHRCLCNKDGTPLFTDPSSLNKKSHSVITRLFNAAQKHNGVAGNAVEDAAKN